MTGETRKRPWLAAALALFYPGLGHVYVRAWIRAILWFGAVVLTAIVFVPEAVFAEIGGLSDLAAATAAIPPDAAVAMFLIAMFSAVDAYLTAQRANASVAGERCVHCGEVLDEDLSFCHWCTAELPAEVA